MIDTLDKRDREAAYGTRPAGDPGLAVPAAAPAPPQILWHEAASGGLLVEVRSTDRTALLAMLTAVFERAGVDIAWAKITTLGSSVIDVFAIAMPSGPGDRDALERELYAVLPTPPPAKAS